MSKLVFGDADPADYLADPPRCDDCDHLEAAHHDEGCMGTQKDKLLPCTCETFVMPEEEPSADHEVDDDDA